MEIGQPFNPFRMFVGAWIPNALLRTTEVSSAAKIVWARLAQYAGEGGTAFPRQTTLISELGISERCLRMCLHELVRVGLIEIVKPGPTQKLKHASDSYLFLWHPILEEGAAPHRQKLPVPPAKIAGDINKEVEENHLRESFPLNPPKGDDLPSGPLKPKDEDLVSPEEIQNFFKVLCAKLASGPVLKNRSAMAPMDG